MTISLEYSWVYDVKIRPLRQSKIVSYRIPSVRDVNRTLGCYRGGALRDQLNNSFERDQDNSDDFF